MDVGTTTGHRACVFHIQLRGTMTAFPIHTLESAPDRSKPLLEALRQNVGMVPNLAAGMASSPELLEGFLTLRRIYANGTFTAAEIQMLSLVAAYENDCGWCVAFHTAMARSEGVALEHIDALRAGGDPDDDYLGPLCEFARAMVRGRGAVSLETLNRFVHAGVSPQQALEVVLGMAFSLMANYAGHLVNPTLDAPLEAHGWHRPSESSAALALESST